MGKVVFRVRDSEFFLCHDTDHSLVASVSRQSSGPKLRFPSRDTDRCAALSVPRRVSGPKMRILSSDTDGIGSLSVSWQEAGLRRLYFAAMPFTQAFVGCLSRRRLSPKCARRTCHRQRGIRFCCAHSTLKGRCAQLSCAIRHLAGPLCAHFGGKH